MQVCAVFHMLPVSRVVFGKRCCCPSHSRAACFSGSNAQRDVAFHGLLSRRRGLVRFLHACISTHFYSHDASRRYYKLHTSVSGNCFFPSSSCSPPPPSSIRAAAVPSSPQYLRTSFLMCSLLFTDDAKKGSQYYQRVSCARRAAALHALPRCRPPRFPWPSSRDCVAVCGFIAHYTLMMMWPPSCLVLLLMLLLLH